MTDEPTSGVEAVRLLRELHAIVKGECPSLLDETRGGYGELDLQIEAALATPAASPATATCNDSLQVEGIPRAENTGRYLAETNDGRLLYLNHANQWQEMPNILRTPAASPSPAPAAVEDLAQRLRDTAHGIEAGNVADPHGRKVGLLREAATALSTLAADKARVEELVARLKAGALHDGHSSDWWVEYCRTITEAATALSTLVQDKVRAEAERDGLRKSLDNAMASRIEYRRLWELATVRANKLQRELDEQR